jgi:hypothetical protein
MGHFSGRVLRRGAQEGHTDRKGGLRAAGPGLCTLKFSLCLAGHAEAVARFGFGANKRHRAGVGGKEQLVRQFAARGRGQLAYHHPIEADNVGVDIVVAKEKA